MIKLLLQFYNLGFRLGYFVGLYEGEGTCNLHRDRRNPNRAYSRLTIRMTDREPIESVHRIFGGAFHGPYSSPSEATLNRKPKYRWSIGKIDGFETLARLIYPHLSPRRQGQIQKALDIIDAAKEHLPVPGNHLAGVANAQRPRRSGQLVCPDKPEPSARGYQRHRALGIPVCDTCRESSKLYYAARRVWYKDRTHEINREQYQKNRETRREAARAYRRKTKASDDNDPAANTNPRLELPTKP